MVSKLRGTIRMDGGARPTNDGCAAYPLLSRHRVRQNAIPLATTYDVTVHVATSVAHMNGRAIRELPQRTGIRQSRLPLVTTIVLPTIASPLTMSGSVRRSSTAAFVSCTRTW